MTKHFVSNRTVRLAQRAGLVLGILLVSILALASCANAGDGSPQTKTLYFSGIPDQDVSRWARRYSIVEDALSDALGVPVTGIPVVDYSSVVTSFERGDIQIGWFGGLTGVQARLAVPGARAVAQRPQDTEFHSVYIVGADIDAETLANLRGLTFTFGSESSTSGHLMPRHFLVQAGVNPDVDFNGLPSFSGSHDTTWKLVEAGAFQAGALSEAVWDRAVREGRVDTTKIRELMQTPPYFDYNWTVRPDMDDTFGPGFTQRLVDALLAIDDPEVLELFTTDSFIPSNNDNYQAIEDAARKAGIVR